MRRYVDAVASANNTLAIDVNKPSNLDEVTDCKFGRRGGRA